MQRLLIGAATLAVLVACDDQAPSASPEGATTAASAAQAEAPAAAAPGRPELPKSTRMLPIPDPGPLTATEDGDEVELYSAVITAVDCAKKIEDDKKALEKCGPVEAARSGFAIYDPAEGEVYLLDPKGFHQFELEAGFQGSMDVTGTVIGTRGEIAVISPEDYTITPKPAAGAFKGCL